MEFEGTSLTLCEAVAGTDDLRIWLRDGQGAPFGTFGRIDASLGETGQALGFAMNAGMFHADRGAVGLLITEGRQDAALVTRDGPGNFGLLPNGVFCIGNGGFAVVESRAYASNPPACSYASQSGPMLVIDGALHPRFLPGSDSLFIRNGVGVSADGQRAAFVISNEPVNFHRFARVFRDALAMPNALYFDGKISRLYAPELGRQDSGFPMGPIVGTVVPAR
ncbi:MAG: phosphodiester glycosidase family protein [Paracoccaceae bacterium]